MHPDEVFPSTDVIPKTIALGLEVTCPPPLGWFLSMRSDLAASGLQFVVTVNAEGTSTPPQHIKILRRVYVELAAGEFNDSRVAGVSIENSARTLIAF